MSNVDQNSVLALSAVISLTKAIVEEVSDETYTDMLNGSVVSSDALAQMVGASMGERIANSMKYSSQEK